MSIDFKKDKIALQFNIERCRELYDTGILFNGGKNPFIQAVFIELLIRLRHLDHILNTETEDNSVVKNIRDAGAHPWLNRKMEEVNIIIDFCRNFTGNWKYENGIFEKQDDECDVSFQYGDVKISAKEILRLIEKFELKIKDYEN